MSKEINTKEYSYDLPEDRIALHPLLHRDQSKLLVYDSGAISHHQFASLPDLLPKNSILFFNNTKVIPARLLFQKDTGALIEVFLLHPANKNLPLQQVMEATGKSQWVCTIGNSKRWKEGTSLEANHNGITIQASHEGNELVDLSWEPSELTFAEVINSFGEVPLPPYLNRKPIQEDKERYQTVYSHYEGAVAAPTAGLHFTDEVLSELGKHQVSIEYLTLHVSAGTFQPIKTENALAHVMHAEQMVVSRENIESLLQPNKKVIAVGTTSLRTLESLYWYGVQLIKSGEKEFKIDQNYPYKHTDTSLPSRNEAFQAILGDMATKKQLVGETSIFIVPGYQFRVCEGLITNFHQPGSTLILLVSAFLGGQWKHLYEQALASDYRFLSYGDSSLLLP